VEIDSVNKWEKGVVGILNLQGWSLEWAGAGFSHYDAIGTTPQGLDCVIEMKFRTKYYKSKMMEKYKYDALMDLSEDVVKLYFVNDPKGNYMYWLDSMDMPEPVERYCPDTTLWTKKRLIKKVYLLKEGWSKKMNLFFK
jgi:hypothetical protein